MKSETNTYMTIKLCAFKVLLKFHLKWSDKFFDLDTMIKYNDQSKRQKYKTLGPGSMHKWALW